jgi:hypothetical protein
VLSDDVFMGIAGIDLRPLVKKRQTTCRKTTHKKCRIGAGHKDK